MVIFFVANVNSAYLPSIIKGGSLVFVFTNIPLQSHSSRCVVTDLLASISLVLHRKFIAVMLTLVKLALRKSVGDS